MFPTATRLAHLSPQERAAFAVSARLISCLVTESLLDTLFFPLTELNVVGLAVLLLDNANPRPTCLPTGAAYQANNIFAIIPLQHIPILSEEDAFPVKRIRLLDPLDMLPLIFRLRQGDMETVQSITEDIDGDSSHVAGLRVAVLNILKEHGWILGENARLETCRDPLLLWSVYAKYMHLEDDLTKEIANEFASSLKWQTYSYQFPPEAPQFSSSSIEWEQSIVEGHPTHPMHKTRYFLPPLPDFEPGTYDLYHAKLRLVAVPRNKLKTTYQFEKYVKPIVEAASQRAGELLTLPTGSVALPVHELQIVHIQNKFPEIEILPEQYNVPILAQQSIRSVQVPDAYADLSLKLGVGLKLTSAVRTISPASAYLGPRFSSQVVPHLQLDPKIVTVAKELCSAIHTHPDPDIAKHCALIVREAHENTSHQRGERLIVCTALVESGHTGENGHVPAVIRIFDLDTEEKRVEWLDSFVRIFFRAFLPSVLHNGVAFECHPQNCLARYDLRSKEIRGFIIRDFGGIRVHSDTLRDSTGVELDFLDGHSVIAPDLNDVYTRMYHAAIHNHLQQLIRVLGLHYNGLGWDIIRKYLMDCIPQDHALYASWLSAESKTLPSKCFLRMRMAGMYRFHLHSPVPNLIHYHGCNFTQSPGAS
ncbi:hypothetical protein AX17_006587 [Amanita inopinata Kibby_2008]|nr:hypothetical protein AX17_006587 [Amanita inopinata Kibby_2008]